MSDNVRFKIENVSLTQDEWEALQRRLNLLDDFFRDEAIYSLAKSKTKTVFSVDYGGITSERHSFSLAINHYAKKYLHGIKITEI